MTTKEGSTKIVNIVTPGAGVLCRGGGWDDKMGRLKLCIILIMCTLIAVVLTYYYAALHC